jgi:FtsH-binding integral membrane protein
MSLPLSVIENLLSFNSCEESFCLVFLFAALGLYASFINIFLRVLQFIALSRRR